MTNIIIGAVYRHYKNKDYRLIGLARHSESLEELVVYQALYDAGGEIGAQALWVRPKNMFFELINYEGELIPRFRLLDEQHY